MFVVYDIIFKNFCTQRKIKHDISFIRNILNSMIYQCTLKISQNDENSSFLVEKAWLSLLISSRALIRVMYKPFVKSMKNFMKRNEKIWVSFTLKIYGSLYSFSSHHTHYSHETLLMLPFMVGCIIIRLDLVHKDELGSCFYFYFLLFFKYHLLYIYIFIHFFLSRIY